MADDLAIMQYVPALREALQAPAAKRRLSMAPLGHPTEKILSSPCLP